MNCDNAIELMNAAIDGTINSKERAKLESHLETCESCTIEFEELKYLVQVMGEVDLKALPVGFEETLHEKLLVEASKMEPPKTHSKIYDFFSNMSNKKWRYSLSAVAVFAAVLVVSGPLLRNFSTSVSSDSVYSARGGEAAYENEKSEEMYGAQETTAAGSPAVSEDYNLSFSSDSFLRFDEEVADNALTATESAQNNYRSNRLIIYSGDVSLQLEDYDVAMASIETWITDSNGYIENSSTHLKSKLSDGDTLKYGYLTLRIPVEGYNAILEQIKALGLVVSEESYADDVTKAYRDTAENIENLKVTETRLREIMEQATDVSDILEIENELTRIRSQIANYEQQIKDWEALADMATIRVSIDEVENLEPVIEPIDNSLWTRAREAFIESVNALRRGFENLFIWVISNSIALVVLAVLGFFGYRIYKKRRHK